MRSVWKYPLKLIDEQTVTMPGEARLLSVQMQHDTPTLWAVVDTNHPTEERSIYMHGTGHPVHNQAWYFIDTFQTGQLVFHVFSKTR